MIRKRILIAEDDKDLQEGLTLLFSLQGYKVIPAGDGMSAYNLAQNESPDLIILDLSLPWADGYKVMERLRSSTSLSDIPIIILTGRDPSINRDRALKAGAEAFFQKPFDNNELLEAVEEALSKYTADGDNKKPPKKKILLIDSDENSIEGIDSLLSSKGFNITVAKDALSVYGVALKVKPDLILLDLNIKGGTGFQVMERLRSFAPLALTPVIILTGRDAAANKQKALKGGAHAFFQKPCNNQELVYAIENTLKRSITQR
jgi:DNA-binding response OmpR family regulator